MVKIIVLDGNTLNPGDLDWQVIKNFGETTIYDRTVAEQTVERAIDADIILVNKHPLTAVMLKQLPGLKCICVTATGYNNVDVDFAKSKNIPVCNVLGYSTASVAQHVFSMILNFTNNPQDHNHSVQEGQWQKSKDFSFHLSPFHELARKTLGIYGFGRIGQKVAEIAQAFEMKVIVTHKHPVKDRQAGVQFVHIEELFQESDFISLHAPLTLDNVGIVNKKLLQTMKQSAYLINTARGSLINDIDLREALENKQMAGAGLDVLSTEPPSSEHPLLGVKNCIITPHMSWATVESRKRLLVSTAENIKAFLDGNPRNVVNQ
ncbi:MAG: glycerate dehydrogenase [Saprospiraceae bacterium]|jgi:glycerate dehydrogenase